MGNIITKTRKRWAYFGVLTTTIITGVTLMGVAIHNNEKIKTKSISEYLTFANYKNENSKGTEYEIFTNKEFFGKLITKYNEVVLENYEIDPVRTLIYFSLTDKFFNPTNVKGLKIHSMFSVVDNKYQLNTNLVKDLEKFTKELLKSTSDDKKITTLQEKFKILENLNLIDMNKNNSKINIEQWIAILNLLNLYYTEATETIVKPAFIEGNYTTKDIEDKITLSNFALNFIEWQLASNSVEDDIKLAKINIKDYQKTVNELRIKNYQKIQELNKLNSQLEERYNILLTQSLKHLVTELRSKNKQTQKENESISKDSEKKPDVNITKDLFNTNQIKLSGNNTSTTGFEKINKSMETLNYLITWNKQFSVLNNKKVLILDSFIEDINKSIKFSEPDNQGFIDPLTISINVVYNLKTDKININDIKI